MAVLKLHRGCSTLKREGEEQESHGDEGMNERQTKKCLD